MNKYKFALLCAAALFAPASKGAVTSANADGYLDRAVRMYVGHNYEGCLDQLSQLFRMDIPDSMREEAKLYFNLANFHLNNFDPLAISPASAHRHEMNFVEGNSLFYNENYKAAVVEFEKVPETAFDKETRADLRYRKAFSYIQVGDIDKAAICLDKLKGVSRYKEETTYYTAFIDYSKGDYEKAADGFRSAAKGVKFRDEARFYLCQIMFEDGDYAGVQAEAADLLSVELPDTMKTELRRIAGESEYHLGNMENASKLLHEYVDALIDYAPERSSCYILGVCEYRNGNYEAAKEFLGAATNADDEMSQSAYLYAGQACLREGDVDAASIAFEKAYRMPYDQTVRETAFYNYAVAQSRGGRTPFSGTVKLFQDFLNDFPDSRYASEAENYIINAYLTEKDYDNALASIEAVKRPSEKMLKAKQDVLYRLGMREAANRKTDQAIAYLLRADSLAACDSKIAAETSLWLAELYYKKGNYAEAETRYSDYFANADRVSPNRAKASYGLGYARYQLRKYAEAEKAFGEAVTALSPALQADAYCRIADCRYYRRDFSGAEAAYDKAFALDAGRSDYALFQKGMMRGMQRDQEGKIALMNRVVADYPQTTFAPKAVYEKSQALESLGKYGQAVDNFKALIADYPQSAEARQGQLQLALLLNAMGKTAESREQYESLVRKYPSSEEAKVAIDDLKRIYAAEGRLNDFSQFLASAGIANRLDENEMASLTFEAAENSYLETGDAARVKTFLEQYPDDSNAGQAAYYVAEAASAQGDNEEALIYVDRALASAPDAAFAESALGMQGELRLERGEYATAKDSFEKLLQKATSAFSTQRAQVGLLRAAVGEGHYEDAVHHAEPLLSSAGLSADLRAEVLYARATARAKAGDEDAAIADYAELTDKNIETLYGSIAAIDLGTIYYNRGDYKNAETTIDKLIDSASPHQYWMARGFILLSDVYAKQGDNFKAREYLESLRSNYPGKEAEIFDMIDKRLSVLK